MAPHPRTRDKVISFFHQHPGEYINYRDVAKDIGHAVNATNAALNTLTREHPQFGISRGSAQGYYIYRPVKEDDSEPETPAETIPTMFERVGTFRGDIMVRDESGKLYILTEE